MHPFGQCTLSQNTLNTIKQIKESLTEDARRANPAWANLFGKMEETADDEETKIEEEEVNESSLGIQSEEPKQLTQFFFTQMPDKTFDEERLAQATSEISDIIEVLYEELELNNRSFKLAHLKDISDKELTDVVIGLKPKLSIKSLHNLCNSLSEIDVDERINLIDIFCTNIILPKIIDLEEKPSKQLEESLLKCANAFPEDVLKFIFVPLLNIDLKNTIIVDSIIRYLCRSRKDILVIELIKNVKDIKPWHIQVLQILSPLQLDFHCKDKLVQLLSKQAFLFAKEVNFGKFFLTFLKTHSPFTDEQKYSIQEIVMAHTSTYKKPLITILKSMD